LTDFEFHFEKNRRLRMPAVNPRANGVENEEP